MSSSYIGVNSDECSLNYVPKQATWFNLKAIVVPTFPKDYFPLVFHPAYLNPFLAF